MWRLNLQETRGNLFAAIARRCPQEIFISDPTDTRILNLQFTGYATCDEIMTVLKTIPNDRIQEEQKEIMIEVQKP